MTNTDDYRGYVESFIALASPMKFDIMVGDRYRGQFSFPCEVGSEYSYEEVKMLCRLKRPSLSKSDFNVFPTGKPQFRQ